MKAYKRLQKRGQEELTEIVERWFTDFDSTTTTPVEGFGIWAWEAREETRQQLKSGELERIAREVLYSMEHCLTDADSDDAERLTLDVCLAWVELNRTALVDELDRIDSDCY